MSRRVLRVAGGPVDLDRHSLGVDSRVDQVERDVRAGLGEESRALAEDHGDDEELELVDEMNLLVVPVVVGQGTRLFPATGPDIALDLVDSRAFPKGGTLQVYRPTGRLQYATA